MKLIAILWAAIAGFNFGCITTYREVGVRPFGEEWFWAAMAISAIGAVVFWGAS